MRNCGLYSYLAWSLSVRVLVMRTSRAKTAESIEMPFGSRLAWAEETQTWVHVDAIWRIRLNDVSTLDNIIENWELRTCLLWFKNSWMLWGVFLSLVSSHPIPSHLNWTGHRTLSGSVQRSSDEMRWVIWTLLPEGSSHSLNAIVTGATRWRCVHRSTHLAI